MKLFSNRLLKQAVFLCLWEDVKGVLRAK